MKVFYLFFILLALNACKAKVSPNENKLTSMQTDCPEDGYCETTLQNNKKLSIKVEESTGYLYPQIEEGENILIEFTYNKGEHDGAIVDASYSETIHFEISKDITELSLKNDDLKHVNLIYGKHCFCPDAGYYAVSIGELNITRKDSYLNLELYYEIEGTETKTQHIVETLKIN